MKANRFKIFIVLILFTLTSTVQATEPTAIKSKKIFPTLLPHSEGRVGQRSVAGEGKRSATGNRMEGNQFASQKLRPRAIPSLVRGREGFNQATDTAKKFKPANLLQSNMVIQQNKPMKFWGWGPVGDEVKIQADWSSKIIKTTIGANGNWLTQLKVPATTAGNFTPHTITITHNTDVVKLTNILIGEVWICSGQSNMELRIAKIPGWSLGILNAEQEAAAANYPNIRLFKTDMGLEFEPMADTHGATWTDCNPKTAADFSAVGYFFGRELYQKLNVPIGLIDAAFPATACQAFTAREVLDADSALRKKYVDPYLKGIADNKAKNDKSTTLATLLYPGLIYNKMIYPLINTSISGFIWYQGESNKEDTTTYAKLCSAMLTGWRHDFQQGDLPFYYVQVAPYSWGKKDSTAHDYAKFREEQGRMLTTKNTGMAIITDVGEPNNIHPLNKKPVGIRLAKIALAKTYHINAIYRGPQFAKYSVSGSTITISYQPATIGTGLNTNDNTAPKYFTVAGADKIFHSATAKIVNNQVQISAPEVPNPVAVRYAFTNYPITNLQNAEGLPAAPFRTDDW